MPTWDMHSEVIMRQCAAVDAPASTWPFPHADFAPFYGLVGPNLQASDWARLVVNIGDTANKIILLKTLYPRADLTRIVQRAPATLMLDAETLQDNAHQVGTRAMQQGQRLPDLKAAFIGHAVWWHGCTGRMHSWS